MNEEKSSHFGAGFLQLCRRERLRNMHACMEVMDN